MKLMGLGAVDEVKVIDRKRKSMSGENTPPPVRIFITNGRRRWMMERTASRYPGNVCHGVLGSV